MCLSMYRYMYVWMCMFKYVSKILDKLFYTVFIFNIYFGILSIKYFNILLLIEFLIEKDSRTNIDKSLIVRQAMVN